MPFCGQTALCVTCKQELSRSTQTGAIRRIRTHAPSLWATHSCCSTITGRTESVWHHSEEVMRRHHIGTIPPEQSSKGGKGDNDRGRNPGGDPGESQGENKHRNE